MDERDTRRGLHGKILYGKHLIAALAHDVGKMEHLRPEEGRYVKDDHAVASARALNGWIMECGGERAHT